MATTLVAGQSATVAVAAGDTWSVSKTAADEGTFSVATASGRIVDAGVFGNTPLSSKIYGPYFDIAGNPGNPVATTLTIACKIGSLSYTEIPASGGGGGGGAGSNSSVVAVTTNQSPTAANTGTIYSNAGASGSVLISLPPAVLNLEFGGYVAASQLLTLDANGTDIIKNGGDASAAGGTIAASTVGNGVYLKCVATGVWATQTMTGDWTLT